MDQDECLLPGVTSTLKGEAGTHWSHKTLPSKYCRVTLGVQHLEDGGLFAVKVGKRGSSLPSQRRKSSFTSQQSMSRILPLEHHSFNC